MKKLLITASALMFLGTVSASALDFNAPITNIDGTAINGPDGKSLEMTVGKVCVNALSTDFKDEQIDGVEKMKRWSLAKNIQDHRDYSMSVEEIALVKKLVAKMYPPVVVGPVWQAIDPGSAK